MKNKILILLLLQLPFITEAQKLDEIKVDPVTHLIVKHTTWEKFTKSGEFNSYFRITQIDSSFFFEIRIILNDPKPLEVKEGQELIFTLANGEKVTIKSFKNYTSCTGCGAVAIAGNTLPGIQIGYTINKNELEKLRINPELTKEQYEKHKKSQIEHIKINLTPKSIEHDLSENSYYQIRKAIRVLKN